MAAISRRILWGRIDTHHINGRLCLSKWLPLPPVKSKQHTWLCWFSEPSKTIGNREKEASGCSDKAQRNIAGPLARRKRSKQLLQLPSYSSNKGLNETKQDLWLKEKEAIRLHPILLVSWECLHKGRKQNGCEQCSCSAHIQGCIDLPEVGRGHASSIQKLVVCLSNAKCRMSYW